jgi:hypothetical protein
MQNIGRSCGCGTDGPDDGGRVWRLRLRGPKGKRPKVRYLKLRWGRRRVRLRPRGRRRLIVCRGVGVGGGSLRRWSEKLVRRPRRRVRLGRCGCRVKAARGEIAIAMDRGARERRARPARRTNSGRPDRASVGPARAVIGVIGVAAIRGGGMIAAELVAAGAMAGGMR